MKKQLLFIFLIFTFSSMTWADTIVLVADKWCPYNCIPGTEKPGFLVEISRHLFEEAGHQLEYRLMPWKRAVLEGRKGNINGVIGFTKKAVTGFLPNAEELTIARDVFFVKTGNPWKYNNVDSLTEMDRVGFPNGYHYTAEIDDYIETGKNVHLVPGADPLKSVVKMLLYDRIQTFPENENVVAYYLNQNGLAGKITVAGAFNKSKIFIGFGLASPTCKRDARIIFEGIRRLKDSGEYNKILKRYWLAP